MYEAKESVDAPATFKNDYNFFIEHFSGRVLYNVKVLVQENKDQLPYQIMQLFESSSCSFIKNLGDMLNLVDAKNRTCSPTFNKSNSDLYNFRRQLTRMKKEIDDAKPYFVRCFKPNPLSIPDQFLPNHVRRSIACMKIVESVQNGRLGFTKKFHNGVFIQLYGVLMNGSKSKKDDIIELLNSVNEKLMKAQKWGRLKYF